MVAFASAPASPLLASFREHERYLWGLCYRMTGSAADADDLVQDTFVRAMERPPARDDEPLRPWLVKVALNLGRDALRRRRRRRYVGPWLPSPVEVEEPVPSVEVESVGTEARYDLLESVSMAFLVALEALTPQQRAVLLLRDVFEYSVRETAEALDLTEANVKVTHHRARLALEPYERARRPATAKLAEETRAALYGFLYAMSTNDLEAAEAMLTDGVIALNDSGGEFSAARKPVRGRHKVANMHVMLAKKTSGQLRSEVRMVNGLPALVVEQPPGAKLAPRFVLQIALGPDGRIAAVYTVLASAKLGSVRPLGAPS